MNDLKELTRNEIDMRLKTINGWEYKENKISKSMKFKSFPDAVNFIKKLTPFFQKTDHHPDIHIYYKDVKFELQRFDIGGKVTERDFTTAKKIEEEYKLYKY
jgi:4a-hydroxytetrahydrobiopterin dehydratase